MKPNKSILTALIILVVLQIFSIINQFRISRAQNDLINALESSTSLDISSAESSIESNIDAQSSTIDDIKSSIDEINSNTNY